ncbi:MAG: hypothetical protein R3F59_19185 [Myxococcota bacterium]
MSYVRTRRAVGARRGPQLVPRGHRGRRGRSSGPTSRGRRPGEQRLDGFSVAGLDSDREVVVSDVFPPALLAAEARGDVVGLGGILGADRLAEVPLWIDPRAMKLAFVEPEPGSRVAAQPATEVVGGGATCLEPAVCFDWGRARMLVRLRLADRELTALVDTASSYVTLTAGAMARAGVQTHPYRFDGAPDLADLSIGFTDVVLDDLVVPDVAVMTATEDLEQAMIRLSVEVGEPVDVLLGESVLERFVTGIDFGGEQLELRTFDHGDGLGPPHRVHPGALVVDGGACFVVSALVADGPAAAAGLEVGDCVTAIGPWTPDGASAESVLDALQDAGDGAAFDWIWEDGAATLTSRTW